VETHFLTFPLGDDAAPAGPCVLALGVFDGVHLGHNAVIGRAISIAQQKALPAAVLTFVEHPRTVLRPDQPVPLLSTWREKRDQIFDLGVDRVIGAHFTPSLAQMEAEAFVRNVLLGHLSAAHVVVGFNFRFGHNAAGGPALISAMADDLGFGFDVVAPFELAGTAVSSSEIRRLLATGDLPGANRLLGQAYALTGLVVGGDQRGRRIGFPTANLHVNERKLLPAFGVYAGFASWAGERHSCVVNIGIRPTFDPPQLKVEAHLLDYSGDLYGQTLAVSLLCRLRAEMAFSSVDALVKQIHDDVGQAREMLLASEAPGK